MQSAGVVDHSANGAVKLVTLLKMFVLYLYTEKNCF